MVAYFIVYRSISAMRRKGSCTLRVLKPSRSGLVPGGDAAGKAFGTNSEAGRQSVVGPGHSLRWICLP